MPFFADAVIASTYASFASCLECLEKFYQLWSSSWHARAMQPNKSAFAQKQLTPQEKDIAIADSLYPADLKHGVVDEKGVSGGKEYNIEHVLLGKNFCYFLTQLDRGRFQTLPIAHDVIRKESVDTTASAIRHFPGVEPRQSIEFRSYPYTFNIACYSCHLSQLSTNYEPKTDTNHSAWTEPGINYETRHGPATEHNKITKASEEYLASLTVRPDQWTPLQHRLLPSQQRQRSILRRHWQLTRRWLRPRTQICLYPCLLSEPARR